MDANGNTLNSTEVKVDPTTNTTTTTNMDANGNTIDSTQVKVDPNTNTKSLGQYLLLCHRL